jgi:hemolysin activation/secretion protein
VKRKVPDATGAVSDYLLGVGVGVTMAIASRYNLSLDWAYPLNDHPARDGKDDGRVWFTMSASY